MLGFGSLAFDSIVSEVERRGIGPQDVEADPGVAKGGNIEILKNGVITDLVSGAPQGSPVSPLLCSVVLHVLDRAWGQMGQGLGVLVRFADDFVVLTLSRARAEQAKVRTEAILEPLGLRLHPDKIRISSLSQGQDGFVFLGLEHRMVES